MNNIHNIENIENEEFTTININNKDYTIINMNINHIKRKRDFCLDDRLMELEQHKNKKIKQFNKDLEIVDMKMKNLRISKRKSIDILENDINKKIKLIETKPIEIKANEIKPNEIKANEIKPNEIKPNEIKPNDILNKTKPHEILNKTNHINSDDVYEYDYEYFSGLSPRKTSKLNKDDLIYRYIN